LIICTRKVTVGETRADGDESPAQSWVSTERGRESESYSEREREKESVLSTVTCKRGISRVTPGDRLSITATEGERDRIIGTDSRETQRGESCAADERDAGDVGGVWKGEDGGRREDGAGNGVDVGWSGSKEDVRWQEECSMLRVQVCVCVCLYE
jgi:hypothetical protein